MSNKLRVAVMMSTYNGETYMVDQIESILNQKEVDVTLFIRDDGSTDETKKIINNYEQKGVILYEGDNLGPANSFFEIICMIPKMFDYYSLADQDDLWDDDKLFCAIKMLEMYKNEKALYASDSRIMEKDGYIRGPKLGRAPHMDFLQTITLSESQGCTMVWNKQLHQYLTEEHRRPSDELLRLRMHDIWIALVADVIGITVADGDAHMSYRQHESNVIGLKKRNRLKQWTYKITHKNARNVRSRTAKELYEKFSDLIKQDNNADILKMCAYYSINRDLKKKLLKDKQIYVKCREKKLEFQLKVLLNVF